MIVEPGEQTLTISREWRKSSKWFESRLHCYRDYLNRKIEAKAGPGVVARWLQTS